MLMDNIFVTHTQQDTITAAIKNISSISASTFYEGGATLSGLVDVDLQGVTDGSILVYNSNEFVARTLSGGATISVDGVLTLNPDAIADAQLPQDLSTTGSPTFNNITLDGIINNADLSLQLDSKAPIHNPIFTGTVSGITATMVGLGAVDNTSNTYLLDRTHHTGSQSYTTITGLGSLATQDGTFSNVVNKDETQIITGVKEFTTSPIVPRPTASGHAVNKAYADDISAGLHVHEQVHVILTVSLESATGGSVAYTNGTDGAGAKLTVTGGSTVISALNAQCGFDEDLIAGVNGSRVIINGEAANKNWNGIYTISADRELTRAVDFDSSVEMAGGDFVFVTHGTTHADTGWVSSEAVTTVGTSHVEFVQFSGQGAYDAGDGLRRDGTIFTVVGSTDRIIVGPGVDLATHGTPGTYQSVTTDAYGRVTAGTNPTTLEGYGITDAASSTGLSNHISNDAVHLSVMQNTLLDSITVTSDKINYLSDVTSSIQSQINGKSPTSHIHAVATSLVAGFLSTDDKTKLDTIQSGAEVNINSDWNAITGDAAILNKPTTLSGYGISDAVSLADSQNISGEKTFGLSPHVPLTPTINTQATSKSYVDTAVSVKIGSDTTGLTGATALANIVQITQAGYNAITPLTDTLYIIVG